MRYIFHILNHMAWLLYSTIIIKGTLCPCDYSSYQGSCYRVLGSADSDKKTWRGARLDCQQKGGDLASVTDQQEQDFIWGMHGSNPELWIGLFHEQGASGDDPAAKRAGWRWTDGAQYSWMNWRDGGYPDPQQGEVHVRMKAENNAVQWQGKPADGTRYGYACKQKPFYGSDTVCSSVRCYTFVEDGGGRTWSEARNYCQSINQQLLSVPPDTILAVRDDAESVINNRMCTTAPIAYWTEGQPSSSVCPSVLIKADGQRWSHGNAECTEQHYFICSRAPRCPPGWRENAGFCYYISDSSTRKTQPEAQQACQQLHPSAKLLSLTQPADTQFISLMADQGASYWIGLTQADTDSPWTWVDDTPYNYINWAPSHPIAGHTCAYLYGYRRYSDQCTVGRRFACKGRVEGAKATVSILAIMLLITITLLIAIFIRKRMKDKTKGRSEIKASPNHTTGNVQGPQLDGIVYEEPEKPEPAYHNVNAGADAGKTQYEPVDRAALIYQNENISVYEKIQNSSTYEDVAG